MRSERCFHLLNFKFPEALELAAHPDRVRERSQSQSRTRHDLVEILLIAFLAVPCGARHCSEMAEFRSAKLRFLKRFLTLNHGVPSHGTFSTVFRMHYQAPQTYSASRRPVRAHYLRKTSTCS
jgi:hypothetical protein